MSKTQLLKQFWKKIYDFISELENVYNLRPSVGQTMKDLIWIGEPISWYCYHVGTYTLKGFNNDTNAFLIQPGLL